MSAPEHTLRAFALRAPLEPVDGMPIALFMRMVGTGMGASNVGQLVFLVDSSGSMGSYWPNIHTYVNGMCDEWQAAVTAQSGVAAAARSTAIIWFSRRTGVVPRLHSTLSMHEGGGTDIHAGVKALVMHLNARSAAEAAQPTTVVFVSDGDDSSGNLPRLLAALQELPHVASVLNFLCWGVGSGFPTGLAMWLRDRFHRGPASSPPVFLLESAYDNAAFIEQYKGIMAAANFSKIKLEAPAMRVLPWHEAADATADVALGDIMWLPLSAVPGAEAAYATLQSSADARVRAMSAATEHSAAASASGDASTSAAAVPAWGSITIPIEGAVVRVAGVGPCRVQLCEPQHDDVMRVFKSWTAAVQLVSLTNTHAAIKSRAITALSWMTGMRDEMAAMADARDTAEVLLASTGRTPRVTIMRRLQKRMRGEELDLTSLLRAVKEVVDGNVLSSLSDAERAQRLKIGTVTGKHHDRALDIRGLDAADFSEMKSAFIRTHSEVEASIVAAADAGVQPRSVVSLENMWDVFTQQDLRDAVNATPSAFHWPEICPLVGAAITIERSDASMISPFMIRVRSLARLNAHIDSLSLLGRPGNTLELGAGDGDRESMNAVLPLFAGRFCAAADAHDKAAAAATDAPLAPLLRTRLFQLLVHFQVCGNVDTFDGTSYLALLAATAWTLLTREAPSAWRTRTLRMIADTTQMVYGDNRVFRTYVRAVRAGKACTLVTDHPDNSIDGVAVRCEHLTKPVLSVLLLTEARKARAGAADTDTDEEGAVGVDARPWACKYVPRALAELYGRVLSTDTPIARFASLWRVASAAVVAPATHTVACVDADTRLFAATRIEADDAGRGTAAMPATLMLADGRLLVNDAEADIVAFAAALRAELPAVTSFYTQGELTRAIAARADAIATARAREAGPGAAAAAATEDAADAVASAEATMSSYERFADADDGYMCVVDASALAAVYKGDVTAASLITAFENVFGQPLELDAGVNVRALVHALRNSASIDRARVRLPTLRAAVGYIKRSLSNAHGLSVRTAAVQRVTRELTAEYHAAFMAAHAVPPPHTPTQVQAYLERVKGERLSLREIKRTYHFRSSGLLRNACACPSCPHYLSVQPGSRVADHLSSGWEEPLAIGLHEAMMTMRDTLAAATAREEDARVLAQTVCARAAAGTALRPESRALLTAPVTDARLPESARVPVAELIRGFARNGVVASQIAQTARLYASMTDSDARDIADATREANALAPAGRHGAAPRGAAASAAASARGRGRGRGRP